MYDFIAEDGTVYTFPSTLGEVTVERQQLWSATYGYNLSLQGVAIDQVEDPTKMQLARTLQFCDFLTQGFAFWSNSDLEHVRATVPLGQISEVLNITSVIIAMQGPHMPIPEVFPGELADTIVVDGEGYYLNSPADFTASPATHADYVFTVKMAQYLLELAEGDWSNFHNLLSGYLRYSGEGLSPELLVPNNPRAMLFRNQINMGWAAPVAKYFLEKTPVTLQVIDSYTLQQLNPGYNDPDPSPEDPQNTPPPGP